MSMPTTPTFCPPTSYVADAVKRRVGVLSGEVGPGTTFAASTFVEPLTEGGRCRREGGSRGKGWSEIQKHCGPLCSHG